MSKQKLSKEKVLHIARLCNLSLNDEEVRRLSDMLTDTLDYIDILEELDTKTTPETYQVTGLTNVFQKEEEKPTTLAKEKALANAKEVIRSMFATEAVFDR